MALVARISKEVGGGRGRAATRRTLSLHVPAISSGEATEALIHNLSQYGMRLETAATLRVNEIIRVELPEAGSVDARVIWAAESSAGCRFLAPVPNAAVSAALLRSPALNSAYVETWQPDLPMIGVITPELTREIERIETEYEQRDLSNVLMVVALFVALAVSASFILALLRIAAL